MLVFCATADIYSTTSMYFLNILTFCLFTIFLPQGLSNRHCKDPFLKYGDYDSCYYMFPERTTYTQAREKCFKIRSDLIAIESQEELNIVVNHTRHGMYWIGLTDKETEGIFKWNNGNPYENTMKWHPGKPSARLVTKDCARYDFSLKKIVSQLCGVYKFYFDYNLCEKEVSPTTVCDGTWLQHGNHCYYLYTHIFKSELLSWSGARNVCQALDGDLTVINNREEWTWLLDTFSKNDIKSEVRVWMGLKNVAEVGTPENWTWIDGTPYFPENVDGVLYPDPQDEDCVLLQYLQGVPTIGDIPCDYYNFLSICETDTITSFCHWPPPGVDPVNMTLTCATQDEIPIDCLSNLFETGTHIILECKSSYESSTGFPLALTICQENGDWTSVEVFKCK